MRGSLGRRLRERPWLRMVRRMGGGTRRESACS